MRVQSLRQEMAASQDPDPRTGIFTTGIIAQVGPAPLALFFTGQNHAGENLNELLQRRAADLAKPLQMCDALSRNEPKEFQTMLCNCILHGRRNFIDVVESFPEECRNVIESLRDIYRFEALAKEAETLRPGTAALSPGPQPTGDGPTPPVDARTSWTKRALNPTPGWGKPSTTCSSTGRP